MISSFFKRALSLIPEKLSTRETTLHSGEVGVCSDVGLLHLLDELISKDFTVKQHSRSTTWYYINKRLNKRRGNVVAQQQTTIKVTNPWKSSCPLPTQEDAFAAFNDEQKLTISHPAKVKRSRTRRSRRSKCSKDFQKRVDLTDRFYTKFPLMHNYQFYDNHYAKVADEIKAVGCGGDPEYPPRSLSHYKRRDLPMDIIIRKIFWNLSTRRICHHGQYLIRRSDIKTATDLLNGDYIKHLPTIESMIPFDVRFERKYGGQHVLEYTAYENSRLAELNTSKVLTKSKRADKSSRYRRNAKSK
jgi:hypothetical protein